MTLILIIIHHPHFLAGSIVYTAKAVDRDNGINGRITYSIAQVTTPGKNTSPFQMDSATGKITLSKQLNYEGASVYYVIVRAEDGGSPKRYGKLFYSSLFDYLFIPFYRETFAGKRSEVNRLKI